MLGYILFMIWFIISSKVTFDYVKELEYGVYTIFEKILLIVGGGLFIPSTVILLISIAKTLGISNIFIPIVFVESIIISSALIYTIIHISHKNHSLRYTLKRIWNEFIFSNIMLPTNIYSYFYKTKIENIKTKKEEHTEKQPTHTYNLRSRSHKNKE